MRHTDRLEELADELEIVLHLMHDSGEEPADEVITVAYPRVLAVLDELRELPGLWSQDTTELRRAVRWLERAVAELEQKMDVAHDAVDLDVPDAGHRIERVVEWLREAQHGAM